MRPVLWVPDETPPSASESLGHLAEVYTYPSSGALPPTLRRGDMVVLGGQPERGLEVAGRLESLRYVQTLTAGVDGIVGLTPPGAILCDAAGVHDVAVAEWVVMMALACRRRLPEYVDLQREGRWAPVPLVGDDLNGSTVLLVGIGAIGSAVEARLLPFGTRIMRIGRRPRDGIYSMGDLVALLPLADIVVILVPLTPETTGVFDARAFAAMRPGALLINGSRGRVVDTPAMTVAVLAGRIQVALDVTEPEPLPAGHPLWSAPGALITPHVASDVRRQEERAWRLVQEQVERLTRGDPLINAVAEGY